MRTIAIMIFFSIASCLSPAVMTASSEDRPLSGAVNVAGVNMDKTVTLEGHPAVLVGAGLLRYRTVFKGYVAGLYLERGHGAEDVFTDIPKRLEIEYFHAIPAQGFIDATQLGLVNNLSREQLASIQNRANTLYALYRDVKPKDRYAFTYIPGIGSRIALNNKVLGTISGLDFANAFFSIWLGRNPLDQKLKQALLGR
ncbi:MAG: chalcone isomerase family protein [Syntrophaceae bacterium]